MVSQRYSTSKSFRLCTSSCVESREQQQRLFHAPSTLLNSYDCTRQTFSSSPFTRTRCEASVEVTCSITETAVWWRGRLSSGGTARSVSVPPVAPKTASPALLATRVLTKFHHLQSNNARDQKEVSNKDITLTCQSPFTPSLCFFLCLFLSSSSACSAVISLSAFPMPLFTERVVLLRLSMELCVCEPAKHSKSHSSVRHSSYTLPSDNNEGTAGGSSAAAVFSTMRE